MTDEQRLARFGAALEQVRARIGAKVGEDDVKRVKRLRALSLALEVAGRVIVHFSFEPISFVTGTVLLWLHKQLEATEIGHTVLHGAYDGLAGAERFRSKGFWWKVPIDERTWMVGHNTRHHGATNVAGKDPDIHFGPIRLTERTPHRWRNKWQLPFALLVLFPNFAFLMNLHFTGLNDYYDHNGLPGEGLDFLPDRSPESRKKAWRAALRKWAPYYALEYGLYPALAGPFFWKVMLANWLSSTMRDVYSAATIFCGHVGERTASYPAGTKPRNHGEWCAMQIEASNDFEVPYVLSVLCGGLDRQIEHHLFPRLAPERLREIAPEVKKLCEEHGVEYRTGSWPETLRAALAWIAELSKANGGGPVSTTRAVLSAMA